MPKSVFDILGPVMIGPSSSHTAGAARIARLAATLAGDFKCARCILHGSFAATGKGHGTDAALAAGLLGMREDDERLRDALMLMREAGKTVTFEAADLGDVHDNTVRILFGDPAEHTVTGSSLGGGSILITEYDGFPVKLNGEGPALVLIHYDRSGVVAEVTGILARHKVNIAVMEVSRQSRGELASMTIECDGVIPEAAVKEIGQLKEVKSVRNLKEL